MHWTWDPQKDRINRRKHRVSFETAQLALRDPGAVLRGDPYPFEQRWRTTGRINGMIVTIVHTLPEDPGEPGRIISARKANREERREYAEGI